MVVGLLVVVRPGAVGESGEVEEALGVGGVDVSVPEWVLVVADFGAFDPSSCHCAESGVSDEAGDGLVLVSDAIFGYHAASHVAADVVFEHHRGRECSGSVESSEGVSGLGDRCVKAAHEFDEGAQFGVVVSHQELSVGVAESAAGLFSLGD